MASSLLAALVAVLFGVVLVLVIVRAMFGSVSRVRVERFARRQGLVITPGNGNLVIAYLGITRRWRVLGLGAGVLLTAAWSLRDSQITVNALTAFAGWFIGGLVAEYRIASIEPSARRAASLEPRLLRRQIGTAARVLLLILVAVTVIGAGGCLLAATDGRDVDGPQVFGYLAAAVLTLGLPVLVGRHVLSRPRPLAVTFDRQRADDALRDRSLHVLAGCAIALTAFPAANLALQLGHALAGTDAQGPVRALGLVLELAGPIGGWVVATRSRSRPQSGPRPAADAAGPAVAAGSEVAGPS